jgi:hypothetical protein
MSNTRTEIESSQSGANSAQALLVAHIELLQDGEPHSLGSKFFSGSLRFTPTHDPSRLTNLSFLDDWGKEPDASDAPFRQGTSASVLLNAAFVKVPVASSEDHDHRLVGFVIPISSGSLDECLQTSLRSTAASPPAHRMRRVTRTSRAVEASSTFPRTLRAPSDPTRSPCVGIDTSYSCAPIASAGRCRNLVCRWWSRFWSVHRLIRTDRLVPPRLSLSVTKGVKPGQRGDCDDRAADATSTGYDTVETLSSKRRGMHT